MLTMAGFGTKRICPEILDFATGVKRVGMLAALDLGQLRNQTMVPSCFLTFSRSLLFPRLARTNDPIILLFGRIPPE